MIPLDSPTHPPSISVFRFSTERSCGCAGHPVIRNRVTGHRHRTHDNRRRRPLRRIPIDVKVSAAIRPETERQMDEGANDEMRWRDCVMCMTSSRRLTRSQMKLLGVNSDERTDEMKTDDNRTAIEDTDIPSLDSEQCHSPDVATRKIDTKEDTNNRLPPDPRRWTRDDVRTWLKEHHAGLRVDAERFPMNGKALCIMTVDMFNYRVPHGGATLHADFRRLLSAALDGNSTDVSGEKCNRIER